jgi:hypothetical protein
MLIPEVAKDIQEAAYKTNARFCKEPGDDY